MQVKDVMKTLRVLRSTLLHCYSMKMYSKRSQVGVY